MRRGSIMTILLTMWLCATSLAQEQQNGICFHDNKPWKEVLELAQKENSVRFSLPKPDFARVAATCGLEKYKGRLLFSAGEKPYLSLRLKKGDDVLKLTNLVLTDFAAAPQ